MSEPAQLDPAAAALAQNGSTADAAQQPLPGIPNAPAGPAVHPVFAAVIQGVQATTPPENWATTAAGILQNLLPVIQPAEAISRASPTTQGEIAIGLAALTGFLKSFFPHPQA